MLLLHNKSKVLSSAKNKKYFDDTYGWDDLDEELEEE